MKAEDNYKERARAYIFTDLFVAVKSAHAFDPRKRFYSGIGGTKRKKGDVLGKIGHSGNSFFPHLHFQLMDSSDILSARGLPCAFENY